MKRHALIVVMLACCTVLAQSNQTVLDYLKATPVKYFIAPPAELDLEKVDLEHGFIKFSPKDIDGQGEFKLWHGQHGDIVGVTTFMCGPQCGLATLFFLEPTHNYRDVTAKMFKSPSQDALFQAYRRQGGTYFKNSSELSYTFHFDQKGTGISILDGDPLLPNHVVLGRYTFDGTRFSFQITR
jgi:hypothetical protein